MLAVVPLGVAHQPVLIDHARIDQLGTPLDSDEYRAGLPALPPASSAPPSAPGR